MTGWAVPGVVHVRQVAVDAVGRRVVARHRMNRRAVSVTYLSPEFRTDAEFRDRFAVESERLAQVRDASVARVHQYVECGDDAAIVADHVEGMPLRALLFEEGALGTEAAVVVFKDALRGLAAGHAAGLAHGDLKPEYVVVTRAGRARLVDFGLSTHAGRRLLARSTPFYLAPEQWRGGPASGPADLYAATVIFFECLVGAPPFYADSPTALAALHERGAPPLDAVPETVRELVRSGLVKDPARRPDARRLLIHVEETAAHGFGPGWERRGRRELAGLLVRPAHPADLPVVPVPRDHGGRVRHVRLAGVLGGALVLAVGLSSPPLPSVLLPGPNEVASPDQPTPPAMAFPGPPNGTAGLLTNGESATPDGSRAGTELGALPSSAGSAASATPTVPSGSPVDQDLSPPAVPTPRSIPSPGPRVPDTESEDPVTPGEPQPHQPSVQPQPGSRVVQAALSDGRSGPQRHRPAPEPRTYSGADARDPDTRDNRARDARDRDNRDARDRDSGERNARSGDGGDRTNCGAADEHGDDTAPGARRTPRSSR